ncbi:BURP domain-containing protein 3, partial [Bienertia sinuspersici]
YKDTSHWHPRHVAFQLLRIEPGSNPICLFVNGDTIVWVQNQICMQFIN